MAAVYTGIYLLPSTSLLDEYDEHASATKREVRPRWQEENNGFETKRSSPRRAVKSSLEDPAKLDLLMAFDDSRCRSDLCTLHCRGYWRGSLGE